MQNRVRCGSDSGCSRDSSGRHKKQVRPVLFHPESGNRATPGGSTDSGLKASAADLRA